MKKYTIFAGNFDGHGDALVQYCAHCQMEEVQGFAGSHWTPPLGKCSLQYEQSNMHTPFFFMVNLYKKGLV
jgi:hypothetical protein